MNAIDTPDTLRLVDHPAARQTVVATRNLAIGSVILTEPVLTSVLFPDKAGRRCDYCHRSDQAEPELRIRKCTGCGVQWYCDEHCQRLDWDSSHRLTCKSLLDFILSKEYEALSEDQMMDCRVMSQLVAKIALQRQDFVDSIRIFESLLPSPLELEPLPVVPMKRVDPVILSRVPAIYQRFPNNNHVIQIHLRSIGVAILPWTSRLLNHSCSPNAVLRYILSPSQKPRAEVVTIREISEGEEVSIPYLDPAISYSERQSRLKDVYGFDCTCKLCTLQSSMNIHPVDEHEVWNLVNASQSKLHQFAFGDGIKADFQLPAEQLSIGLPEDLHPLMHHSVLTALTERFSLASEKGPFEVAMTSGKSILAVYLCIYPPYYPLIGFHALEMAKIAWNEFMKENGGGEHLETATTYLAIAERIINVYGREGDSDGPLDEASELFGLIRTEGKEQQDGGEESEGEETAGDSE